MLFVVPVGGSKVRRGTAARAVIVALTASFLLGVAPMPARANHTRYQQLQDQIAETRSKIHDAQRREHGIISELAASDSRRIALEAAIGRLEDQLAAAGTRLGQLDAQLGILRAQMQIASAELEEALADVDDQERRIANRAASLYIHSTDTYTTVLLGHHDYHDFMAATEYESRVLGADVTVLDDLELAKAQVEVRRQLLEWKREAVRKQQDAITQQARAVDALRRQEGQARSAILSEIDYREQLLRRVRDEKQAYVEALNNMLAESASIEALLNGAQAGQKVFAGGGHGYLVWPTTGRITSPYGWRTHPIYGYRSFHTGIDIGAPQGNKVIAARRGEVLYTGYKGAYGLVVIIDHGNQFATVYAHLSRVYVHSGQLVSTKQLIAAVGSTGWSTGPHLHFEARINGQHTNPIRYL